MGKTRKCRECRYASFNSDGYLFCRLNGVEIASQGQSACPDYEEDD